jgi:hypothetical protein
MGKSDNPFKVGDTVRIQRGPGWLTGEVVKTVLARCHIQIDGKVFVEDWHSVKQGQGARRVEKH